MIPPPAAGGMAERLNAPVLKTGNPKGFVGSNPTPSATGVFVMPAALPPPKIEKKLFSRGKVFFGVGLAMVIGISLIAWRSTQQFLRTAERVAHSREILELEEKVLRFLMEMESARRGYLVSGNERMLRDYEQAQTQVNETYLLLRNQAGEDPDTKVRIEKVRSLLNESFRKQRMEIEARRHDGFQTAAALFGRGEAEMVNRELHALITDLEALEQMRVSARALETEYVGASTTLVIILGSSVAVLALVSSGWLILRDFAARRRAEAALEQQARLLTDIIDTIPEMVYLTDAEGRYLLDNRAHRRYLGVHSGESVLGKTAADLYPKELATRYAKDDLFVLSTGAPIRNHEEPARPASPNIHWLSTTKMAFRNASGKIIGLLGVNVDITKRKADEEKLQRFAEQLERSNAELQNFASVASHDLQEPLRKIQAFGDRLRTKCSDQLGEQGRDYLERMQNAAHRMQTLIQDLLQLSRITSRAQPFQSCDLNKIVTEVISDLEVRIEQTRGQMEVGDLPTIDADPLQMRQLFQNLIANALKFHQPDAPPAVRISSELLTAADHSLAGARPRDRITRIRVQDNGIGFDPKFADQIFVVFQRLHTKQEYEGTGIGLAVCRKITDRHGGTIVAHSEPGQGATFEITLPVKQPIDAQISP
jgi:PAS domain S-box-containing protein